MRDEYRMPGIRKSLIDAVLGPSYVTPRVQKPIKKVIVKKPRPRFPDELVLEIRRLWTNEGFSIANIIKRVRECGFEVTTTQVQNWVMYRVRNTPEMRPPQNAKPYLKPIQRTKPGNTSVSYQSKESTC